MMPDTLRSARLTLRKFTEADAPFIFELVNQPAFLEHIGDRGVRSVEDATRYLRQGPMASWERHGFGPWAVEVTGTSQTIGLCGLLRRDHLPHPDIGYAYLPHSWKNGYAIEAAKAVLDAVSRPATILGIVTPTNFGSIRVLERLGFALDAKLPPEKDGAVIYSLDLR